MSENELSSAIDLREAGKYHEAQEWLNQFLITNPNEPEALSLLSQILLLDKKEAESEKILSKVIKINPELPSVQRNEVRLLLKQSKFSEALEKAQILHDRSTDDPENNLILSACFGANKKDEQALVFIEKALNILPNYAEAFANRSLIRLRAKDIPGFIEDAEKATALKPHMTHVWSLLSTIHFEKKNISSGIDATKKACELDPTNAYLWERLGLFFQQDGNFSNASIAYEKSLAINPKSAGVLNNLGAIAQISNDWDSALRYFEGGLEINSKSAEIHNNLGTTLKKIGRLDEAKISYRKAIELKPDYAEVYFNLGITLHELGNLKDAKKNYRKAIALKSDFEEAIYNLGVMLYEGNELKKAMEQFKLIDFRMSKSNLLKCFYIQDQQSNFYKHLDDMINKSQNNAVIGSLVSRSNIRYGLDKINPFCNEPLRYLLKVDLTKQYDFKTIFLNGVKGIMGDNKIRNTIHGLLSSGTQTAGNVFSQVNLATDLIQKTIRLEVEKYRTHFKDSNEGFIKNWPNDYTLYGWVVSMQNGGQLAPHMHDRGWLSGSIYINVPPKLKSDSGNLVVCIDNEKYETKGRKNQKESIDVVTGSLCLFPASLLHYTIPFESEEERVVLAFDVVPKIKIGL